MKKYITKQSDIKGAGKGLFTKAAFKKGEVIGLAHVDGQPTIEIGKNHNHNEKTPTANNVKNGNKRYLVASRDLKPGEEITTNYRLQPELEQPEDFEKKKGGNMTPQKDGYRTYSPFKKLPYIDVESDTIDSNNIVYDLNLQADNGLTKFVKKNTGLHTLPGAKIIREIPAKRKGGMVSLPKDKPEKSKKFSRSLDATNRLYTENNLFKKPKSRRNKVFDPHAKYYAEGGTYEEAELTPEEIEAYRAEGYTVDDNEYQDGGPTSPEEWGQQIKDIEGQIGNPSGWTLSDYNTLQNKLNEYKSWRENTPEGQAVIDTHNEEREYDIPLPEHLQDYTNAMMKARLAYANEFGNPAAKRMINLPDTSYQFDNGDTGTHYMASMDNYAVPQIQDENGVLQLGDYGPESNEAIRFDSDEDANYFAENYKDVSPGFLNQMQDGGSPYYSYGNKKYIKKNDGTWLVEYNGKYVPLSKNVEARSAELNKNAKYNAGSREAKTLGLDGKYLTDTQRKEIKTDKTKRQKEYDNSNFLSKMLNDNPKFEERDKLLEGSSSGLNPYLMPTGIGPSGLVKGVQTLASKVGASPVVQATKQAYNTAVPLGKTITNVTGSTLTPKNLLFAYWAAESAYNQADPKSDVRKAQSNFINNPSWNTLGDASFETGVNSLGFSGLGLGKQIFKPAYNASKNLIKGYKGVPKELPGSPNVVSTLNKFAGGGEPCPQGFQEDPVTGECVSIMGQTERVQSIEEVPTNQYSKYITEYEEANPRDAYVYKKKADYLKKNKGLNRQSGLSQDNFPENAENNFNKNWEYNRNSFVINQFAKDHGINPKNHVEIVEKMADKGSVSYDMIANSKYGSKLQPSFWAKSLAGAQELANFMAKQAGEKGDAFNYQTPGLTKKEWEDIHNSSIGALETTSLIDIPGAVIGNSIADLSTATGGNYQESPGILSGEVKSNVSPFKASLLNPINYVGLINSVSKTQALNKLLLGNLLNPLNYEGKERSLPGSPNANFLNKKDDYIETELTPEEIEEYRRGGFTVEELY